MAIKKRKDDYKDLIEILSNVVEEKTNIKDFLEKQKYSMDESYISR